MHASWLKKLAVSAREKQKDGKTSTERAARAEAKLVWIMPSRKRGRWNQPIITKLFTVGINRTCLNNITSMTFGRAVIKAIKEYLSQYGFTYREQRDWWHASITHVKMPVPCSLFNIRYASAITWRTRIIYPRSSSLLYQISPYLSIFFALYICEIIIFRTFAVWKP